MTTILSTDVEEAWASLLWNHPDVLARTTNIYPYDVSAESEYDIDKLCLDGIVNFVLAKTARESTPLIMNQTRYTFQVQVEYYLQQTDIAESTNRTVRDYLEEIDDLVLSTLGGTWGDTVDYWNGGKITPPKSVTISERKCWFGVIVYTAFKTI